MVSVIELMLFSSGVFALMMLLGYWIYIKTRPKKITWKADVYIEGGGRLKKLRDEKGNIIPSDKQATILSLKPYTTDVLERIEKDKGKVIYRLVKLNRSTPEVSGDCVDYWGKDNKRVTILLKGESCTILRKGYDLAGNLVFQPLPYDKINMITNQMAIRKDRLHKERDLLAQLLPYVAIVGAIIGIVAVGWVMGNAFVDMSENFKEAQQHNDESLIKASETMAKAMMQFGTIQQVTTQLGTTTPP